MAPLRTPLYEVHTSSGATMTEFGGWEMPLYYSGIVEEHGTVRQSAGLFDVSHMGKVLVSGSGAHAFLENLSTNDLPEDPFRAKYTHVLDSEGRIIDDVIVTCLGANRYFVVCNAGPRPRVLAWLQKHAQAEEIQDLTSQYLCLALQGPKAARILQLLTTTDLATLRPFGARFCDLLLGERLGTGRSPAAPSETEGWGLDAGLGGDACLMTRTGYTGEDGFELFPPAFLADAVWRAAIAAGQESGLRPVGLGARDTLRLEKGYLLSGTDFDGRQTSLETGSERFVKWNHEFVGRDGLRRQQERGDYDRLIGLLLKDRGVPRHGCAVLAGGRNVGIVTSGTLSPMLKAGIALAYVRPEASRLGSEVSVVVRDRPLRAQVTKLPFV